MTRGTRRSTFAAAAAVVAATIISACAPASGPEATASATREEATATVAPAPITQTPSAGETSTVNPATSTPVPPLPASTPPATGETGITGIATIGPTCPVERPDSPCPDRPYETRITVWRGSTMVAETRSGADGRFLVLVPAGEYRVVGESESALPHGVDATVEVAEGELASVELRFDSGIR